MASNYISELAKHAFKALSEEQWKQSPKISSHLAAKPGTELALAQQLEANAPLQAEVAWYCGYTPSKWLLENELEEVKTRRSGFNVAWVDERGDIQGGSEKEKAERSKKAPTASAAPKVNVDVYERAALSRLMGICFSGGGIRSATFNLGILQGLAELGLLGCFDYLSSVSGGGYIHQWLAAWISRRSKDKADRAQNLSSDIRVAQLEGYREINDKLISLPEKGSPQRHPEPIRWLRRYSNYLTPEKGFFTADSWVTIATWLRNTLLNQIILIGSLLFLISVPHLFTFSWFVPNSHWALMATIAIIVYLFLLGVALIGRELSLLQPPPDAPSSLESNSPFLGQAKVQTLIVLPLLFAGLLVTLLFPSGALTRDFIWAWLLVPLLYVVLTLTIAFAGGTLTSYLKTHHFIAPNEDASKFWRRRPWCFAHVRAIIAFLLLVLTAILVAFGGAAWHFLVSLMTVWLPDLLKTNLWRLELVIAPPLFLLGPLLTVLLLIGLIGRIFKDSRREWLARLGAWAGLYALIWLLFFSGSLFGLIILKWLAHKLWAGIPALAAWVGTSGLSVLAGQSSKTGGAKDDTAPSKFNLLEAVATVGPYIFIAGLVILLSALAEVLLRTAQSHGGWMVSLVFFVPLVTSLLFAWRVDINEFSMHAFYRDRLARCYLGASNARRKANPFTGFDEEDANIPVSGLVASQGYFGPYPIFCSTLNLTFGEDLAWQERKGASFAFTPLLSGYDVGWTEAKGRNEKLRFNGFAETANYAYPSPGIHISTATAISGAALSPNWGYHTNPATAFLLTLFNVRLGWWLRNPRTIGQDGKQLNAGKASAGQSGKASLFRDSYPSPSPHFSLLSLMNELLGQSNDTSNYLYLSDGGHFDNMGLYELVRRRCRYIVICDAEQDGELTFEGIGMAIRKCRIDFGAELSLDLRPLQHLNGGNSNAHCVVGTITYPEDSRVAPVREAGIVVYVKSSLTGDEPADVLNYKKEDACFPHDSTVNQWFTESQFESYRRLGHHVAQITFGAASPDDLQCNDLVSRHAYFRNLQKIWSAFTPEMQLHSAAHSKSYLELLEKILADSQLPGFFEMLFDRTDRPKQWKGKQNGQFDHAVQISFELIEFIFVIYLQLKLVYPENLNHPFAQGWLDIFRSWATIDVIQKAWSKYGPGYAQGFQIFVKKEMGIS